MGWVKKPMLFRPVMGPTHVLLANTVSCAKTWQTMRHWRWQVVLPANSLCDQCGNRWAQCVAREATVPKSNWTNKLGKPPYMAYAVTCGITLTYDDIKVDTQRHALDTENKPIPGLFAAGKWLPI